MARISALAPLFQAIAANDWLRARELAEKIADSEQDAGHHAAASTLRGAMVDTGPRSDLSTHDSSLSLSTSVSDMLVRVTTTRTLASVELNGATAQLIDELAKEFRHRNILAAHCVEPRKKFFFYGPPGCGKTVTASAIARELELPLYVVRFDALVGSYLGQTSIRVRELFRFAEQHQAVVLVDEIDAIGRRRGRSNDVTEMDRVVVTFMQQLDLTKPKGFLIAASNLPDEIDPALLRRFDVAIEFPLPSPVALEAFAMLEAKKRGIDPGEQFYNELRRAVTYADAERIVAAHYRRLLLRGL